MLLKLFLATLASIVNIALAEPTTFEDWKGRTIYQVLTDRFYPSKDYKPTGTTPEEACENLREYCGGTYDGLTSKLDYIQDMGFDAIWITPVVQNVK
jgi:alpha-amylase